MSSRLARCQGNTISHHKVAVTKLSGASSSQGATALPRNNETMPRPRFPDAAPCHLSTGCCEEMTSCASPSTRKGISQVASFLPFSGHSGHGRNCCSLDPVAIDPFRTSGPRICSGTAGYRSRYWGCEDECNFAFTLSPYRQHELEDCTRGGSTRGPYSSPMSFDDRSADR